MYIIVRLVPMSMLAAVTECWGRHPISPVMTTVVSPNESLTPTACDNIVGSEARSGKL